MRLLLSLILLLIPFFGDSQVGMQKWREHLPYSKVIAVENAGKYIYAATPFTLIRYNLEENFTEKINTINALSDVGISALSYSPSNQWTIVGYSNGNIDLVRDEETYNLPAIKMSSVLGSKKINKFHLHEDLVYVCTDFGVVTLDIEKFEFNEAFYPEDQNIPIYDIAFWRDSIYLTTSNGIYSASAGSNFLQASSSWSTFDTPYVISDSSKNTHMTLFNQKLYVVQDRIGFQEDTLWVHDGNIWASVPGFESVNIKKIRKQDNRFLVSLLYNALVLDQDMQQVENIFQYTFGSIDLNDFVVDDEGMYWMADNNSGLVRAQNSYASEKKSPQGPLFSGAYKLDFVNGKIALASGALNSSYGNTFSRDGFYTFENEEWLSFSFMNQAQIDFDSTFDFLSVAIDPTNSNRFFAGSSSYRGIFEVINNEVTAVYDHTNSSIQEQIGRDHFYNIHDMQVDDNQTLWIANGRVNNPLICMDKEGNWYSFFLGSQVIDRTSPRVYIDFLKNKWITFRNYGLIAFNENETLSEPSDDQIAHFIDQEGGGNLPSKTVKDVVMDFNNHLWIGTDNGLAVIYNVADIYDQQVDAQNILIDDGLNVEALLGGVDISCIDVDGANRKWIGTNGSGVFCLSPDGTEEIYRFTTQNSPLFSDNILDLRINHQTGEVFFATENGLISFRADATYGDFEFADVKVFPNPVYPDFSGVISIQGVAFNSDVKIMDVSGKLAFQTTSNGGTIVWDGNLPDGTKASTGVYIVMVGEKDRKGKVAAKILFMN